MVRPIKEARKRFLERPLTVIFGAPSHISLLRALRNSRGGMTGREVARLAGVAPYAALEGLSRLESAGLVRRRFAGSAHLFELNWKHRLLARGLLPLLEEEASFKSTIVRQVRSALGAEVASAALYGSVARGEDHPGSDLDLCVIVERTLDKERVLDRLARVRARLAEEYGVMLSPIVFTQAEFVNGYRKNESFYRNVVRDGLHVLGRELREVMRGQENGPGAGGSKQGGELRPRRS